MSLILFDIPMKLVRWINMYLNETCSRVRVGKHLCDMLPIRDVLKWGDALSPLLFNFAVEYTIRRVQFNHDGLKLSGTHQLLVYADGVNVLGWSLRTIKKNTEALVVASKETGLEVNADKTKYTVTIDNGFFERVKEFRYLGTTLTNKNSVQEEIKSW
jgi:hypothetical protein